MAIISGTTVSWWLSPRIITIPTSDTSITIEDLQDTLLSLEDDEEGIVWPHLRETSGGEDLGGGVTVGLTMELQNAQVAFSPRTTQTSSGTVTTANSAGTTLIDSAATFVTDGVTAGATIVNFTDQSVATVVSVDSETQLTCYQLADGADNQFDSSDAYKVWNETQCEVAGGNLVAVNDADATISSIFPTFGTQVLKTSASSATTQNQEALEHSSFNGYVAIDQVSGTAGTEFPAGTLQQPVDNITDAITIANERGFSTFKIIGDATFGASPSLDGWAFIGNNRAQTTITFSSADTGDISVRDSTFSGGMNGAVYAENCSIGTVTGIGCTTNTTDIRNCSFTGDITLRSDNNKSIHITNCASVKSTPVVLDANGTTGNIYIHNFFDRLTIKNVTQNIDIHFSGAGSELIIDSSCTNGTIEVHGDTLVEDNGVGTTVEDHSLNAMSATLIKLGVNRLETNPATGTITLYDDDDTTVLYSSNIYEDVAGSTPYSGNAVNRRNRLT